MAFPITDIHPVAPLFTPGQLCLFRMSEKVEAAGHRYIAFRSVDTLDELMPGDHGVRVVVHDDLTAAVPPRRGRLRALRGSTTVLIGAERIHDPRERACVVVDPGLLTPQSTCSASQTSCPTSQVRQRSSSAADPAQGITIGDSSWPTGISSAPIATRHDSTFRPGSIGSTSPIRAYARTAAATAGRGTASRFAKISTPRLDLVRRQSVAKSDGAGNTHNWNPSSAWCVGPRPGADADAAARPTTQRHLCANVRRGRLALC